MAAKFTQTIDAALLQMQGRGATPAQVERARGLLTSLAEHNPVACRVELCQGVSVEVPGNPLGMGFRTGKRADIVTR